MGEQPRPGAPARNRVVRAGGATTVSQARHDSFVRICRITLNRPGT
jgi:hypothetical protein